MDKVFYTTFNPETGEISQSGWGKPYVRPGEEVIEGMYDSETCYVHTEAGEHVVKTRPPRPNIHVTWDCDLEEWIDKRTPTEVTDILNKARGATWRDKAEVLIALKELQILSETEAEEAAGGIIPARFLPLLATLPAGVQSAARIKWKADVQLNRNHPVICAAAYAVGVTDEQLDQIFGVEVPQ